MICVMPALSISRGTTQNTPDIYMRIKLREINNTLRRVSINFFIFACFSSLLIKYLIESRVMRLSCFITKYRWSNKPIRDCEYMEEKCGLERVEYIFSLCSYSVRFLFSLLLNVSTKFCIFFIYTKPTRTEAITKPINSSNKATLFILLIYLKMILTSMKWHNNKGKLDKYTICAKIVVMTIV